MRPRDLTQTVTPIMAAKFQATWLKENEYTMQWKAFDVFQANYFIHLDIFFQKIHLCFEVD